jgi:hypothetical protein
VHQSLDSHFKGPNVICSIVLRLARLSQKSDTNGQPINITCVSPDAFGISGMCSLLPTTMSAQRFHDKPVYSLWPCTQYFSIGISTALATVPPARNEVIDYFFASLNIV